MVFYLLMAVLFISLAALEALNASFVNLQLMPWFNGMRWLRVHLITLGALTEVIFGVLPGIAAARSHLPRPSFRWDIWLSLNAGLLALLVGIPLVNAVPIIAGGTLIFVATILLIGQVSHLALKPDPESSGGGRHTGRKFYLAGLSFFLLGILIGTGLWFGWPEALKMNTPIEVHIHANNWGLLSLVFAGLIVDLYPEFAGRPLAWPRSISPIFWLMVAGAFGLVIGPWTKLLIFTVPGLILHLAATGWLLANVIRPLWGDRTNWSPGLWHLTTAYIWFLAPVLFAPAVILNLGGLAGSGVEQNAPQALIYGWALQVGFALLPFVFQRTFLPGQKAELGGSWFSLVTIHLGSLLLWAGILIPPVRGILSGLAYAFWALSILPIAANLWQITRAGQQKWEETEAAASP